MYDLNNIHHNIYFILFFNAVTRSFLFAVLNTSLGPDPSTKV